MSFVEQLLPLERNFFLWLNQSHTLFWDNFMYMYTDKYTWLPLIVLSAFLFLYKVPKREAILMIIGLAIIGILCDQISSTFIKPYFERLRPSHHPDFKDFVFIVKGYRGGQLGFVSSHAANGFGIAIFTSLVFRYRWYTITSFLWVFLTAYSRIYLGVHFITDIIGGILVAVVVAPFVYWMYRLARRKLLKVPEDHLRQPFISRLRINFLIFGLVTTGVVVAIYSMIHSI